MQQKLLVCSPVLWASIYLPSFPTLWLLAQGSRRQGGLMGGVEVREDVVKHKEENATVNLTNQRTYLLLIFRLFLYVSICKTKRTIQYIFCVCVSITGCQKYISFCAFSPNGNSLDLFSLIILKKVQTDPVFPR